MSWENEKEEEEEAESGLSLAKSNQQQINFTDMDRSRFWRSRRFGMWRSVGWSKFSDVCQGCVFVAAGHSALRRGAEHLSDNTTSQYSKWLTRVPSHSSDFSAVLLQTPSTWTQRSDASTVGLSYAFCSNAVRTDWKWLYFRILWRKYFI